MIITILNGGDEIRISRLRCRMKRLRRSINPSVQKLVRMIDAAQARGQRVIDTELFGEETLQEASIT